MPSATEVQDKIIVAMRNLYPSTQTHSQMANRLEGFARALQVAMNMDAMAKAGILELLRDGSEFQAETKQYRLPANAVAR